jgi:hypothetical protein
MAGAAAAMPAVPRSKTPANESFLIVVIDMIDSYSTALLL